MHEVLVNYLGGLRLSRKSVVRMTDCPDMTTAVYRELEQQHNNNLQDKNFYFNLLVQKKKKTIKDTMSDWDWHLLWAPPESGTGTFYGHDYLKYRGNKSLHLTHSFSWRTRKIPK